MPVGIDADPEGRLTACFEAGRAERSDGQRDENEAQEVLFFRPQRERSIKREPRARPIKDPPFGEAQGAPSAVEGPKNSANGAPFSGARRPGTRRNRLLAVLKRELKLRTALALARD